MRLTRRYQLNTQRAETSTSEFSRHAGTFAYGPGTDGNTENRGLNTPTAPMTDAGLDSEALRKAVVAYDEARCAAHGHGEKPMSERNRETIAPMISAAIAAYLRSALDEARAATAAAVGAEREACARLADEYEAMRFRNAEACASGSQEWGIDPAGSEKVQLHKAVSAMHLARAIRARGSQ